MYTFPSKQHRFLRQSTLQTAPSPRKSACESPQSSTTPSRPAPSSRTSSTTPNQAAVCPASPWWHETCAAHFLALPLRSLFSLTPHDHLPTASRSHCHSEPRRPLSANGVRNLLFLFHGAQNADPCHSESQSESARLATIRLLIFHIPLRIIVYRPLILRRQRASQLPRMPHEQTPRRNNRALRHQRPRRDDRARADLRAIQNNRAHANQASRLNRAAMQNHAVANRHIVAQNQRMHVAHHVQHRAVLHICALAEAYVVHVSANHHAGPDARMLANLHIANNHGRFVNVSRRGNLWRAPAIAPNQIALLLVVRGVFKRTAKVTHASKPYKATRTPLHRPIILFASTRKDENFASSRTPEVEARNAANELSCFWKFANYGAV